jgi:hypothetical protein
MEDPGHLNAAFSGGKLKKKIGVAMNLLLMMNA